MSTAKIVNKRMNFLRSATDQAEEDKRLATNGYKLVTAKSTKAGANELAKELAKVEFGFGPREILIVELPNETTGRKFFKVYVKN